MNNSKSCTIDDVKILTHYEQHRELIDAKLGGKSLDEIEYSGIEIINEYIIRIRLSNSRQVLLPIIATAGGHRAMTSAEKQENEILEQERALALRRARSNLQKIDRRKAQGIQESNFCLTEDDRREWWSFLENSYPRNYMLAQRYYSNEEDHILKRLGRSKKDYTVNEYFEIYGLPRIFTDQDHNIQVNSKSTNKR